MAAIPVEILLGLYLGLLTGIVPALIAGVLGFVFRYFTGVSLPGFGVVVLAVGMAGVNGGLLGLIDPSVSASPRLMTALLVVMMLSLYAHNRGDRLGATMPRRFSLRGLGRRTLSAEAIESVGGFGEVTVRPAGPVQDVEGYPPLPADLRTTLEEGAWTFPADLPLEELGRRLEERLATEHDLAAVSATVDADGKARIAAAPPTGALSRRVPEGHRAVSVPALVPTGLARGEAVRIDLGDDAVEGTLVSARSSQGGPAPAATDGGEATAEEPAAPAAPTTVGGEGRVTVAVPRDRAADLLRADRGRVVVQSRGSRREYELLSLLRRAGNRIERLTVGEGPLDGTTIGAAGVREAHGVAVLAVRRGGDGGRDGGRQRDRGRRGGRDRDGGGRWTISPGGEVELAAGDELFVVGPRDRLAAFRGVVA